MALPSGHNTSSLPIKTSVVGGAPGFISGLGVLDVENPEANAAMYENWASSVKDFPVVIDQKVPKPALVPPFDFRKSLVGLLFKSRVCFLLSQSLPRPITSQRHQIRLRHLRNISATLASHTLGQPHPCPCSQSTPKHSF